MEKTNEKTMPARFFTLTIEKKNYQVQFPNTGQMIDIENLKNSLAKGEYSAISNNAFSSVESFKNKISIDMIAYFNVLIPNLAKELNVKSLLDLDYVTTSKLMKRVYMKQFLPWYNDWIEYIMHIENQLLDEEENLDE